VTKSLYDREEIAGFCEHAGLQVVDISGEWDGSPVMPASPSLLIVAQRAF
jgi:hypothetical protein